LAKQEFLSHYWIEKEVTLGHQVLQSRFNQFPDKKVKKEQNNHFKSNNKEQS